MRDIAEKVDRQRLALGRIVAIMAKLSGSNEDVLAELDAIARLIGSKLDRSPS